YVNWDAASIVSLRLHLGALTHLVPEWLTLQNAQGDLDDTSDPAIIRLAGGARLPILALVTNFREGWRGDELHAVLNNPEARANLVEADAGAAGQAPPGRIVAHAERSCPRQCLRPPAAGRRCGLSRHHGVRSALTVRNAGAGSVAAVVPGSNR